MFYKKICSVTCSIFLVIQPLYLSATNIIVDTTQDAKYQADLTNAHNGTPIVNIVNPNSNGLSHNKFSTYSVSNQNAILNNSKTEVMTQLAGVIEGNRNLSNTASTILNEITGTSRTNLEGYTEVAGSQAKVIIANPNGIYIKGGGFINVPQATLTTGTPLFDANVLKAFNVQDGLVQIDGEDFNASNINSVDIYAKAIELNAKLYAQDINMVTGVNTINTDALGNYVSYDKQSSSDTPLFALSSTLLGGLYANKISFIGTQDGVGVNFPSEITTQDSLSINNNGDIVVNKASSKSNMSLASTNNNIMVNDIYANDITLNSANKITNNKVIASKNRLTLIANSVENNGDIAIGVNDDYSISSDMSDVSSFTTNSFINNGLIYNQNSLNFLNKDNLLTNTFINNDKIISDTNILINSESITANDGVFDATNRLQLNANNLLTLNDSLALSNYLDFTAKDFTVTNTSLNANTNLLISSTDMNFINSNINDKSNSSDTLNNVNLVATNSITLDENSSILSYNKIDIISPSLTNSASMQVSGTNAQNTIELTVDSVENRGKLKANDITLNVNTLDNYGGINAIDLAITSSMLTNYGGISGVDSFVITSDDLTNYNTMFSSSSMNLYILNNLINQTDSSKVADIVKTLMYANDTINIQGNESKTQRTASLLNQNAIIQTNLGDINLYVSDINNTNDEAVLIESTNSNASFSLYNSDKSGTYFSLVTKGGLEWFNGGDLAWQLWHFGIYGVDEISAKVRSQNPSLSGTQLEQKIFEALKEKYLEYNLNIVRVYNSSFLIQQGINPQYAVQFNPNSNTTYVRDVSNLKKTGYLQPLRVEYINFRITGSTSYFSEKPTDSTGSEIISGNNLNIDSTNFTNNISRTVAQNDIDFNNSSVENNSLAAYDNKGILVTNKYGQRINAYSKDPVATPTEQFDAVIEAGNDINGTVKSFMNDELSNTDINIKSNTNVTNEEQSYSLSDTTTLTQESIERNQLNSTLPTNKFGRFIANTNPEHKYLIESNPDYATWQGYYSSDYFLNKMSYNPNQQIKRLGDAAYENQLIREAIIKQTGQQYILSNESINEQYKTMMDNAVNMAGVLNLEIGIKPTQEQLANLTQDIVWMELQEVDGIQVLAPVVYLAKDYEKLNGASIVAKNNINITSDEEFINTGNIQSKNLLVDAKSILNNTGKLETSDTTILTSKEDIINKNGASIKGGIVGLTSTEGSIVNETYSKHNSIGSSIQRTTYTVVGNQSNIESTNGNLVLSAKNNIENKAANIKSANDLGLYTQEGDINITSQEIESSFTSIRGANFDKGKTVRHLQSNISGAQDVVLSSGKKMTLIAANVDAGNDLYTNAKDDMDVFAVNNVDYSDQQRYSKKSFGRSSLSRNMTYKESVVGSNLEAKNINLNSEKNITLEAANLKALENIIVDAKDKINVIAKQYKEGSLHYTKKKGFGGFSSSASMNRSDALKLKEAKLQTEALNVILKSGDDINIIASQIDANATAQLEAANNILIAAGEEFNSSEQWSKKSRFNPLGILNIISPVDIAPIYTSEYKLRGNTTQTVKSSTINAGNNVVIDAGSAKVVGSDIAAQNDIHVQTDVGSIEVLSAKEQSNVKSIDEKKEVYTANAIDMVKSVIEDVQKIVTLDTEDTKIKFNVASATYDDVDTTSQNITQRNSNLTANGDIILDSVEDVKINASNLTAKGDIALQALNGSVEISEGIENSSSQTKEKHAKAEINATIQNEYVEAAKAVKEVADAAKQLKDAQKAHRQYKKDIGQLEEQLNVLKQEYANKTPGVDFDDIDELGELISDLKSDEKYYIAGIAAATANLVSKTTIAYQQVQAASTSGGTWGFSAGLSLDMSGSKSTTTNNATNAVASNLQGDNILINTGNDKVLNQTTIKGSHLNAQNDIVIDTGTLNVSSSQSTSSSDFKSKDLSGSISMTMYGAASGPQVNLGYGEQYASNDETRNNNSTLNANNITTQSSGDTVIQGGNLSATNKVTMNVGDNLILESQKDTLNASSHGFNVSAGFSLGANQSDVGKDTSFGARTGNGEVNSVNASYGANNGRTKVKQTVLSSITGNEVDITVDKNTHLKGSLIAAGTYDDNGKFIDNENLKLSTDTLTFSNSTNRVYDSQSAFEIGANIGVNKDSQSAKPSETELNVNSSNITVNNSKTYEKSKTLATIGKGELTVNDKENSDDLERLNRDTDKVEKDIYKVKTDLNVDMTLDHNVVENVENLVMSIKLISKTIETTNKIANALEELKKNDPEKYEATILAMDEHNKNLAKQSNQSTLLPALAIPPLVGELLISAGVITGTVVATQEARNNSVDGIIGNEVGSNYNSSYIPKPTNEEIRNDDFLPELTHAKPKTPVQGGGGLRPRWKDKKGNIYEWDSQHGEYEIYDKQGKHKGTYNPKTKEQKPKVKGRKVEK